MDLLVTESGHSERSVSVEVEDCFWLFGVEVTDDAEK